MSDLAPPSLSHRIGQLSKTILLWLMGRISRPPVLIPLAVLLALWLGFQQNAGFYLRGTLPTPLYDATLIIVLILPPTIGQVTAWLSGHRSGFWWLIWVPTLLVYWLRPWHTGTEWAFFWREHLEVWNYFTDILRLQEKAPLRSFIRLGGIFTMAMASFMVAARSWFRLTAWLREIGRDTDKATTKSGAGAGAGKVEGLPQATWASASDVRDTFSNKGGIVLGEHTDPLKQTRGFNPDRRRSWNGQGKGRLITMNPARGNGHVVVLAASAGYKTAGIVIPNILHYDGPLVVVDPKGDLYARTREAREAKGFDVRVIDARNGFDPFKLIAPLAPEAPSVYLTMARTLMPLGERASDISEYFHDMSTNLFAALIGHYIAENSNNVALDVSAFINREREEVIEDAQFIAAHHNFPFIADELEGLAALDERTFPGVVKGISNKLAFTRFPDVAAYGQSSDSPETHLAALGPRSDIFINFPGQAAEDFSSFSRLLIGSIYVTCELTEQPDRPRARRLFLIDEARVLGGMSALNTIRDAGRSIGLHLMLIYQNHGQLNKAWGGEAGAAAWLDSCEARVISAVGSSSTANNIVNMLGRRTLHTKVQGSSASNPVMTPMGGTVSSSEQEQIREVPLMSAATLGQLPDHGTLIFTRRSKPILATKAIYFTRSEMAPLVKSPDAVTNELDATRRRDAIATRIRDREMQDIPNPQPTLDRPAELDNGDETGPEHSASAPNNSQQDAPDQLNHAALPAPDYASGETGSSAVPDYLAKTRERIAADLKKKAREQTEAEAIPEAGTPVEDTNPGVTSEQMEPDQDNPDESQDDQDQSSEPVEVQNPTPRKSDPDDLSEQDRKMATMILGMLEGRTEVQAAVSRALQPAPSRDDEQNDPAQPAAPPTVEADPDPDAPLTAEDDGSPHGAPADPINVPDPDTEDATPEEIEGAISDNEIAAAADMLRVDQLEIPTTETEDTENGATRVNAAGAVDHVDGGDRNEAEPGDLPPIDERASTNNPASPAEEAHPEDIDGDFGSDDLAAAADMLWIDRLEIPATRAEGVDQAPESAETKTATGAVDHVDGSDRDEAEPDNLPPTDGPASTKDPASPAEEAHPEDVNGDFGSGDLAAAEDMLWVDKLQIPATGAEGDDQAPETAKTKTATGKAASAKAKTPRKQNRKTNPVAQRKNVLDANEIRDAFESHLENFFLDRFGEPAQRRAANWRPRDRDAFSVLMTGAERGKWYDFAAEKGGGLFDLIAIELCNLPDADADFPRVLQAAADYVGFLPTDATPQDRKIRDQQRKERARKAKEEEERNAGENNMLMLALRGLAEPVTGSPAQNYLASRHITTWPTTTLAFLPPLELPDHLRSRVYGPDLSALVVWAVDDNGIATGGQRILIGPEGSKVELDVRKPSFGAIGGSVARFPAPDSSTAEGAPLVIAEGPESALSIWQTTGHETWAVFGVSGWARAPIPQDRPAILAPDRDAPDSPAGRAFRKAVAHHLARGCDLRIAPAPEPAGSKRDLNDTLMRTDGGPDAVRAAINAAHPPGPEDLPEEETGKDDEQPADEPGFGGPE